MDCWTRSKIRGFSAIFSVATTILAMRFISDSTGAWQINELWADNTSPHIITKPMLVAEAIHFIGVILLQIVEVMWVELSSAYETGFVGEDNIIFFF